MDEKSANLLPAAAAVLCALTAAMLDVRMRRIPNWLTGSALAAALAMHAACGGWLDAAAALLAGFVAGVVTFFFFAAGGMGAGDVKLMAAAGCLAGWAPLGVLLVGTAVAGAMCGVLLALRQGELRNTVRNAWVLLDHHRREGLTPHPEIHVRCAGELRMPFAIPIACGCLCALYVQLGRL